MTLNLAASKGLTKRDIDVQWTLISINPSDDELREQIQATLDETFKGKSFYTIPESYVEKLQGKVVRVQVRVKNFLDREVRNQTDLQFIRQKRVEIIDLPDTVTF